MRETVLALQSFSLSLNCIADFISRLRRSSWRLLLSDNIFSKTADFVKHHPVETGLGLVALAGGGMLARRAIGTAAAEFAPSTAVEVANGMTARAVGDGLLFAAQNGTNVVARKGLVQVASPGVEGALKLTRGKTIVELADGTTIRNGGWLSKGEDIWTDVPGVTRQHSFSASFKTPDFEPITIGDRMKIAPTSVEFPGGEMRVRSISGPGDPVDVMDGKFGTGQIENVVGPRFSVDGVTFGPKGYQIGDRGNWRQYRSLLAELKH